MTARRPPTECGPLYSVKCSGLGCGRTFKVDILKAFYQRYENEAGERLVFSQNEDDPCPAVCIKCRECGVTTWFTLRLEACAPEPPKEPVRKGRPELRLVKTS